MTDEKSVVTPGWCTNWAAFNTPRIWAMVADEDNPESWKQVTALGAMADTLKDQRSRLVMAREALVQMWPPETNHGAKAFVSRIDVLLANMADTKGRADENAAHLGHVLETLRRAKAKIEPLYQQYLDKSDDLIPNWWDNAEDDLDKQARQHMVDVERDVAALADRITSPAPYKLVMTDPHDKSETEFAQPGAASHHSGAPGSSSANNLRPGVPHEPPPPLPGYEATVPTTPASPPLSGPSLADVSSVVPSGSGIAAPALPPTSVPSSPPIQPGMVIDGRGTLPPVHGGTPRGMVVTPFGGPPVGRGAYSGAKPTPPSWLPAGTTQPAILGQTGQPGRGASARSAPRAQVLSTTGPAAGGRRQSGNGGSNMGFDPDHPWATAEGVSPVIEPSRRVLRHDPGPGVIGSYE